VQVKGSEPILEGELFNDIAKDDSSWTIGMPPKLLFAKMTDQKMTESSTLNWKRSRPIFNPINGGLMF